MADREDLAIDHDTTTGSGATRGRDQNAEGAGATRSVVGEDGSNFGEVDPGVGFGTAASGADVTGETGSGEDPDTVVSAAER